ncbi:type II secretion system secretin GspD [Aliiroseovarius crassostreae]|uniref:Type II secretion system secretin GspD n=1 Tax=Aliiroseovarius crassostreae TaxID=154981 RepID=A0A9Q9HDI3_9RHOB|nr:type II secretion system secretin GspD [Aliiroseovarius crassostreae]UWP96194.1 type II secretion system secretin GspD [Aliiroseovarius crassostreae]
MKFKEVIPVFALLVVLGCTERTTTSSGVFGSDTTVERTSLFRTNTTEAGSNRSGVRPGALVRGNDQFVNPNRVASHRASKAIVVPSDNDTVEVALVNASISAASKAVLGDALKLRYVVSNDISGTVTIQSTGPIPKNALLELFEAALSANGARLEKEGNVIKVVPGTSGNKVFRLASDGVDQGANIVVAPLEYISANQMVNLLKPLTDDGLTAVADKRRNLLLLTGTPDQLEAALDALNLFDVDVLSGKSIALVELSAANPEAIVDELTVIFENQEGGSLDGVIEFVPNKRLGSVLVITSRSKYLSKAQKWIRELDRAATGASKTIETYELQNRSAVEVAPILENLISGRSSSQASEDSSTSEKAGSSVAADKARNALLVRATRKEHREIRKILKEIDNSPQQVMLEATIAEVRLNDELDLGVRWFFENGNFNFGFSDASNGSAGGRFPGFSAVFGAGGDAVAINALAGVTDVKIISSPTLMVLDNEEAVLQIGDQVPVARQSSTNTSSGTAPTITSIEYRDTGVILRVKPSISRNGSVVLNVSQEVSSVSETKTSGIDSPTIRQRKIATNVLLNDGTTLALGGLVQENDTTTVTKVPGLGDVPVVGNLFKRTESKKSRSELLILIRPRVVYSDNDGKNITDYWRNKLSGANSILSGGLGSASHSIGDVLN